MKPRRWFNWRWRPANIVGRYRMRRLPVHTPEQFDGEADG